MAAVRGPDGGGGRVSGWLNTERQLNVRAATVHEKVNKANSPLLHFELIDRGNNLLHHSP